MDARQDGGDAFACPPIPGLDLRGLALTGVRPDGDDRRGILTEQRVRALTDGHRPLGVRPQREVWDPERAARAVERTLAAQRLDGSWPYGEGHNLSWADCFHTGFVLSCLDRLGRADPSIDEAVARGAAHYRGFSDAEGRSKLWANKQYPEDAHSAGTGLTTLSLLLRRGLVERDLLERVAQRVLHAGLRHGHAVHRRYRRGRTAVRYLRWCDAHVALGLVDAAAALRGEPDLAPAPPAGAWGGDLAGT